MITPATLSVNGDEKAYSLQEAHLQSPGSRGFHRYRIIMVNRGGVLAEYREDLGLASLWKGAKQLNIPSLWEHTVAELIDIVEHNRWETNIDIKDWLELDQMKLA